jgi:glucose/arabinose dehydrogenase
MPRFFFRGFTMSCQRLLAVALAAGCSLSACSESSNGSGDTPQAGNGGSGGNGGRRPTSGSGGADAGEAGGGGSPADGGTADGGTADGGTAGDGTADGGTADGGTADGGTADGGTAGGGGGLSGDTCVYPAAAALAGASVPPDYCAYVWASDLAQPRGVVVDANGDVLVSDEGRIVLLHDDNGNGVSDPSERVVLRTQQGLNHGIALNDGYLYASTPTTVYRWAYPSNRQPLGDPQQVVTGMPSSGHSTRTLQFDSQGRLYVSIGSGSNVDPNSDRARLIRYPGSALGSTSTFAQGQLFADGLRNEVGLALDAQGRVWGVENGRDNLNRADLGGDIHQDNPGEELNLFREQDAGRHYGYPYCWSEYNLPTVGSGPGTQWADPDNTTHDDVWCKSTTNVIPPVLVMQGHSAPLDIKFYTGGSFPADVVGDAIITFHGSWNRTTATGYKVVRVPFGADGMPSGGPVSLLESANPGDIDPQWPHRPVAIGIGKGGQVLITSDATGVIIAVGHDG